MNIRINGKVIGKITVDNGWYGWELSDGAKSKYLSETAQIAKQDAEAAYWNRKREEWDAAKPAALDPFAGLVRK